MQCFSFRSIRFSAVLSAALILALAAASGASAKNLAVASPRDGATLSRTATFMPRIAKGLKKRTKRVEVWVASQRVAIDTKAPFKLKVDTTKLSNGVYSFRIRANVRSKVYTKVVKAVVANKPHSGGSKGSEVPGSKQVGTPAEPTPDPRIGDITDGDSNWNMVFSDEFAGSGLDGAKWNNQRNDWTTKSINDAGQPWAKGGFPYNILEGAWYKPDNSTVSDGVLKQTIRKLATPMDTQHWGSYKYTTGMVNTKDRFGFKYGYVEARIKVPSCSGCWPAFWMLPAKDGWPPEIDIFEFFDTATLKFPYFSTHMAGTGDQTIDNTQPFGNTAASYTDAWHTYGLLWTASSVQVFIDGTPGPTYTGSAVPQESMYLILQQAIGRDYNTQDGSTMETDYVRVYQQG